MIKAVIIDVDDTLCLTEAVCFDMENEVLRRMSREPMSREVHKSTWGQPLFTAILERSPGVDVEQFEAQFGPTIAEYVQDGRLDSISDENYRALDDLIKSGKDIMLLTSRSHGELKHMLEPDHLLASRVKAFYYKDNTEFHKPDPRVFAKLLQEHALAPEACVYIGDSPSDAEAANKAGLRFIASLESGLRDKHNFESYQVDAFIDRFADVTTAVRSLDH